MVTTVLLSQSLSAICLSLPTLSCLLEGSLESRPIMPYQDGHREIYMAIKPSVTGHSPSQCPRLTAMTGTSQMSPWTLVIRRLPSDLEAVRAMLWRWNFLSQAALSPGSCQDGEEGFRAWCKVHLSKSQVLQLGLLQLGGHRNILCTRMRFASRRAG